MTRGATADAVAQMTTQKFNMITNFTINTSATIQNMPALLRQYWATVGWNPPPPSPPSPAPPPSPLPAPAIVVVEKSSNNSQLAIAIAIPVAAIVVIAALLFFFV